MSSTEIEILPDGIIIHDLEIQRSEVAEFLRPLTEPERESTVIRAVEIGILSLERARSGQDLEFVRRQIDSLMADVQKTVSKIPAEIQKLLIEKIGTENGQVLYPIQRLVNNVSTAANDKLGEVRQLLLQEIDPSKDTSTLSRALRKIAEILDPKRSDSIQGSLELAIRNVTANDGILSQTVKTVVADAVRPLAERVDKLTLEFRGEKAAEEALAQTTAKGLPYEEETVTRLQTWAQPIGAEIEYVGPDNKPGDITVKIKDLTDGSSQLLFVIEVRDRQTAKGRKAISEDLSTAMAERKANAAIYLSRNRDGLGKEIGEWAEGVCDRGSWIACTDEHLITAVRFLLIQWGIARKRAVTPTLDASAVHAQMQRIRTALARVKNINTKATAVHASADEIQSEANLLRDEVRGALSDLEELLRLKLIEESANTTQ
ncbi:MAG: hypothetical protein ABSA16_05005 [Thermoguttaceae bacterium]|jgi:hypothetical protein